MLVVGEVILPLLLALGNPLQAGLGVAVVASGLPVYWLLFGERKQANDVDQNRKNG
ncbi:MAG TPA: hypothetical protein VJ464_02380 [Blastocatellia bacterium]|nr:hypothetical protein [Blastocatellia bacterium]